MHIALKFQISPIGGSFQSASPNIVLNLAFINTSGAFQEILRFGGAFGAPSLCLAVSKS